MHHEGNIQCLKTLLSRIHDLFYRWNAWLRAVEVVWQWLQLTVCLTLLTAYLTLTYHLAKGICMTQVWRWGWYCAGFTEVWSQTHMHSSKPYHHCLLMPQLCTYFTSMFPFIITLPSTICYSKIFLLTNLLHPFPHEYAYPISLLLSHCTVTFISILSCHQYTSPLPLYNCIKLTVQLCHWHAPLHSLSPHQNASSSVGSPIFPETFSVLLTSLP